jgi:hypothetical protein
MAKTNISRSKARISALKGKMASVFGYTFGVLLIAGIVCTFVGVGTEETIQSLPADIFMFLFSAFLIYKGFQIKKRTARLKKYTALISGQQISSLDEIAASTSLSVDFVKKDLQKMITKGYYVDMEIDMAANKIIPGVKTAQIRAAMQANMDKYEKYSCPDCGGLGVKPKGEPYACEYCGNAILK